MVAMEVSEREVMLNELRELEAIADRSNEWISALIRVESNAQFKHFCYRTKVTRQFLAETQTQLWEDMQLMKDAVTNARQAENKFRMLFG